MNKPDYLVLINEDNKVPEDFESTVELINVENSLGEPHIIEKKAYEAFMRLREELLREDGLEVELTSVHRTLKFQEECVARNLKLHGEEFTNKYVAKPGHSEHHTGLALDISIIKDGILQKGAFNIFKIEPLFKPIHKKLAKYGFILRYPEGKEDITKIAYEPWHIRYIDSPEIASEITSKGMCFEEYWKKLKNKH